MKKEKRSACLVIVVALLCGAVMAFVDGVLKPGYGIKSAVKAALFLLVPLVASRIDKDVRYLSFLRPKKKGFLPAILLGVCIYVLIVGAYFAASPFFDFSKIAGSLQGDMGVTRENFLFVSLYISFVNSFLEEFFFRAFGFVTLRRHLDGTAAWLLSPVLFAVYHTGMLWGMFHPAMIVLLMAGLVVGGLIFNALCRRFESVYPAWFAHMAANFAINTVGFILFGAF